VAVVVRIEVFDGAAISVAVSMSSVRDALVLDRALADVAELELNFGAQVAGVL
jgi:hypothetical protein